MPIATRDTARAQIRVVRNGLEERRTPAEKKKDDNDGGSRRWSVAGRASPHHQSAGGGGCSRVRFVRVVEEIIIGEHRREVGGVGQRSEPSGVAREMPEPWASRRGRGTREEVGKSEPEDGGEAEQEQRRGVERGAVRSGVSGAEEEDDRHWHVIPTPK
jgi:hypothetical protein